MRLAILMVLFSWCFSVRAQQGRTEYLLEKNWKFSKGDFPDAILPGFNDASWQTVTVPHDWAIYGPFDGNNDLQNVAIVQNGESAATLKAGRTGGLPYIGTGWYRLKLDVPAFHAGSHADIIFDGAMSNAHVYLNGKEVGSWPYGYNSFHFDITPFLRVGDGNVLAVRLENKPESSRWYPGAGLYRNVHVVVTEEDHIPVWGTYVTTPVVHADFAKVHVSTTMQLKVGDSTVKLVTEILDPLGMTVFSASMKPSAFDYDKASGAFKVGQELVVSKPLLWSPETPSLYKAVTRLYVGGELKDQYVTTFGVRTIEFVAGKGFFLNGQVRKFKGVCNHHDLGPLGTAINVAALRRQLAILKDMGCDAIRTSHNMPAPELVRLCDEMGFMLMVESFDEWRSPKVRNGYSHYFDEWAERDITNMVHRDRNHPSVIMWSIGNEVPDQHVDGGNKILKFLQDICHREDPTRPVTAGMDQIDASLTRNFAALLDIPGFNYKPHRYAEANAKLPQGFVLGTETASTVSSRGVYKFPVTFEKNKKYRDNQSSSYDVEACYWSQVPDDEFVQQDSLGYVIGEFVWTGFDYLGEPTPYDEVWPSHSSYFGIVDLAGIPKDRYFLYRSRWNRSVPTLHLVPHWTFPGREGQVTPVYCYTSYASAELFVNGKSMGRRSKSDSTHETRYRLMWKDVIYQPGTLKVVAYDSDGKVAASEEVRTAGKPHHIELVSDRNSLDADGKDLAFVTARVVDAKGNLCPDASDELEFSVGGQGRFRAVGNGDATSLDLFHEPHMHVFKGMLVAIVQSSEVAGSLYLSVKGKGLKAAGLSIVTK